MYYDFEELELVRERDLYTEFDVLDCDREIFDCVRESLLAASSFMLKCCLEVLDCVREIVEPAREKSLAASSFISACFWVSFFPFDINDSGRQEGQMGKMVKIGPIHDTAQYRIPPVQSFNGSTKL